LLLSLPASNGTVCSGINFFAFSSIVYAFVKDPVALLTPGSFKDLFVHNVNIGGIVRALSALAVF
jgi:hypothetical protein